MALGHQAAFFLQAFNEAMRSAQLTAPAAAKFDFQQNIPLASVSKWASTRNPASAVCTLPRAEAVAPTAGKPPTAAQGSLPVEDEDEESFRAIPAPRGGRRYKGIRRRKWGRVVSEIRGAEGKRIWQGSYSTEEEAARVYDQAARLLQGPRAWLNFPNDKPGAVELPKTTVETLLQHREKMAKSRKNPPKNKSNTEQMEFSSKSHSANAAKPGGESASSPHHPPKDNAQGITATSGLRCAKPAGECGVSPGAAGAGEWESLLMSLEDPSPRLWMSGVGPISPATSSEGSACLDHIPDLDLDSDLDTAPASSPLHASSSEFGDCFEDWLGSPFSGNFLVSK